MTIVSRIVLGVLVIGLLSPATTFAAGPSPTIEIRLSGDCRQLTATLSWSNQKHVRSFNLVIESGDRTATATSGSAGRQGSATLVTLPEAALEAHQFVARATLVDRQGNTVASSVSAPFVGDCLVAPR